MDESRLSAIKARANAATPGPWIGDGEFGFVFQRGASRAHCIARLDHEDVRDTSGADLAFIAHARTDVPDLVAEVERLTAALAEARAGRATDALSALAGQARNLVRAYAGGDKDPEIDVESLGAKLVLWRDLGADGADAPWQAGVIEEGGMGDVPILCGNSAADPEQAVASLRDDLTHELAKAILAPA